MSPRAKSHRATPKMPFSLILQPAELGLLRKIADHNSSSVAAVIKDALYKTIFKSHPGLAKSIVENEVDAFFDKLIAKLPGRGPTQAAKIKLKNQIVRGFLKK